METQRAEQLMKARKRQMSLGLHSGRAQHREATFARKLSRHGKKPGLADSRLAVQHERAAAIPAAIKQRSQQLDLGVPAAGAINDTTRIPTAASSPQR